MAIIMQPPGGLPKTLLGGLDLDHDILFSHKIANQEIKHGGAYAAMLT